MGTHRTGTKEQEAVLVGVHMPAQEAGSVLEVIRMAAMAAAAHTPEKREGTAAGGMHVCAPSLERTVAVRSRVALGVRMPVSGVCKAAREGYTAVVEGHRSALTPWCACWLSRLASGRQSWG